MANNSVKGPININIFQKSDKFDNKYYTVIVCQM